MLQATDNYTRTDSDRFRKVVDVFVRKALLPHKLAQSGRWNQCVGGKLIGLALILLHFRINDLIRKIIGCVIQYERPLLSMKEHMTYFVKKRKPHLIVSFVPKR